MGLGLAITPSSSSPASVIIRNAGAGGHSATPSISGSIKSANNGYNTPPMRVSFAKEPVKYSEERELDDGVISDGEEVEADTPADGNGEGALTIKARSLRRTSSWNDSIAGSTRRRVPPKNGSKNKKKGGGGWLEWFVNAAGANANASTGGGGGGFGGTPGVGIIGREEVYESRIGREDWA
jgi:hypothetical protein